MAQGGRNKCPFWPFIYIQTLLETLYYVEFHWSCRSNDAVVRRSVVPPNNCIVTSWTDIVLRCWPQHRSGRMFCLMLRGAEGEKMNLWLNLLAINRWTPRVGNCVSVWLTACMKAGRIHLWDYFTWRRRSALFLFHGCLPPLFIEQDFSPFLFRFFL